MFCSDEDLPLKEPCIKYEIRRFGESEIIRKVIIDPKCSSSHRTVTKKKENPVDGRGMNMSFQRQKVATKSSGKNLRESDEHTVEKNISKRKSEEKLNDKSISEILYDSESSDLCESDCQSDIIIQPKRKQSNSPQKCSEQRQKFIDSLENLSPLKTNRKSHFSEDVKKKYSHPKRTNHNGISEQSYSFSGRKTGKPEIDGSDDEVIEIRQSRRTPKPKFNPTEWESNIPIKRNREVNKELPKPDKVKTALHCKASLTVNEGNIDEIVKDKRKRLSKIKLQDEDQQKNNVTLQSIGKRKNGRIVEISESSDERCPSVGSESDSELQVAKIKSLGNVRRVTSRNRRDGEKRKRSRIESSDDSISGDEEMSSQVRRTKHVKPSKNLKKKSAACPRNLKSDSKNQSIPKANKNESVDSLSSDESTSTLAELIKNVTPSKNLKQKSAASPRKIKSDSKNQSIPKANKNESVDSLSSDESTSTLAELIKNVTPSKNLKKKSTANPRNIKSDSKIQSIPKANKNEPVDSLSSDESMSPLVEKTKNATSSKSIKTKSTDSPSNQKSDLKKHSRQSKNNHEDKVNEKNLVGMQSPNNLKARDPKHQNECTPSRKPPASNLHKTTEKSSTPKTPVSIRGVNKRLLCTPSMPECKRNFGTPQTPLQEAMTRLHVSAVPHSLPCREAEFANIHRFLEGKILDEAGGCIYISGVPGTGKTATVRAVVRSLEQDVKKGDLPKFDFIEINGMRLSHPRQAYVQLWKSLVGEVVTAEQAQRLLETKFTKNSKKQTSTVVLVDEVDVLWTKRQDVVYNLLDWPTKARSHLVVITIANTMDLPERLLMGRVTSRLGLTRLTFQPYTHKQLEEIVKARLKGVNAFDSDAVQFVSRKVASVSGDARRALDICRRATEIAEQESPDALVAIKHVDEAMLAMTSSQSVQAIMHACSTVEKLFLQAVEAELNRTGLEETTFSKVYRMMETLCSLEGLKTPNSTQLMKACMKLSSMRLLLAQHSHMDIHTRIFLNISADDLHYALKCAKKEL